MADYRECKWCGKGFYEDGLIGYCGEKCFKEWAEANPGGFPKQTTEDLEREYGAKLNKNVMGFGCLMIVSIVIAYIVIAIMKR
jgi:hypothetical protein